MGYNQKLPLLGEVTEEQISAVVAEMERKPEYRLWRGGKQCWGWSSWVDVKLYQNDSTFGSCLDFHWALGFKPMGYPEAFREVALEHGLPVGELGEASW